MLKRITVLVSGGGTNLQALIDAQESGVISHGEITHVISSKADAFALKRAEKHGIKTSVVSRKSFGSHADFDAVLLDAIDGEKADLIVLAGFLSILSPGIISKYTNRIINVHPSLIPAFCGKGFYGLKVHQNALDYGVKITGATVHFVNEIPDGGAIILQKAVEILQGDTAEILQERVMKLAEHVILPQAAELFCDDKIDVCDNIASIKK